MKLKFQVCYIGPGEGIGRFKVFLVGEAGQRMEIHGLNADEIGEFCKRHHGGKPLPADTAFSVGPADTMFFVEASRASSEEKTPLKP